MKKHISIGIIACIVCVLLLSACGNRQNTVKEETLAAYERVNTAAKAVTARAETLRDDMAQIMITQAQTGQADIESSARQSFSQSGYLPMGEVNWEAYQEILSGEEYAALQKFFPVLKAAIPFKWTVDAYTYEDKTDMRDVTLDEFCYVLNNELWEAEDDELRLQSIALCDLDRDGEPELILDLNNIGGHFLILKEEEGLYYGTDRVCRGFEDLRINGVYVGSDGAGHNYVYQMVFEEEERAFKGVLLGYESQGNYYMGEHKATDLDTYLGWLDSIMSEPVVYHSPVSKSNDHMHDILYADISNEDEYEAFVKQLENNPDCWYLSLDMKGSDTAVYLDDLMACRSLTDLHIRNGGRILARDLKSLNGSLDTLTLWRIWALDEETLRYITVFDTLLLNLDQRFQGEPPVEKLLDNTLCRNIILVRDDRWDSGALPGLLTGSTLPDSISREWGAVGDMLKDGVLMGIYRLNDGEYIYTDFDFYKPDSPEELRGALISIRDRESGGDSYFDILEIPGDRLFDVNMRDTQRIHRQGDLNFDGLRDLVFTGSGIEWERYNACTVFLWNEEKKRYEFCESAPENFLWPQQEKHRLIRVEDFWDSDHREEYYIYEYDGAAFTDRMLEVSFTREENIEHVNWRYFEEGELNETLALVFDENSGTGRIFHESGGITKEEQLKQEQVYYQEIGKKYFPDFDFYING